MISYIDRLIAVTSAPPRLRPLHVPRDLVQQREDAARWRTQREALTAEARCSCGCREPHEVARRRTFDGIDVLFWSDGAVTGRMGTYAVHAPRELETIVAALRANREAAGDVCVYSWSELPALVRSLRARHLTEVRNAAR